MEKITKKENGFSLILKLTFYSLLLVILAQFFISTSVDILIGKQDISDILLLIIYLVLALIVLKPILTIIFKNRLPEKMNYQYNSRLFQSVEIIRYLIKGNEIDQLTNLPNDDYKEKESFYKKAKNWIKKLLLFVALLIVSTMIVGQIRGYYSDGFENIIIGIALASLIAYVWKKIDNMMQKIK